MRLATVLHNDTPQLAVLNADTQKLVLLSVAAPDLPGSMTELIELGDAGLTRLRSAVDSAGGDALVDASSVTFQAPIPVPRRDVMAVGRNYFEHAQEFHDSGFDATSGATAVPEFPIIFTKATTSVTGPTDPILGYLDPSKTVDYEGELAVIIGLGGRGISKADAFKHVYGYTVCNDVTARTLQHQHKQWVIGKSIDSFCPMGPVILTADEAGPVEEFHLTTHVNGESRQDAKVSELIFDIPTLIECISEVITLLPGDIIATGTPVGVGIGYEPPIFLQKGDVVKVTIKPIGSIENVVE
ncbi:MAG: fumarylacetoacetate hydrolase family protein [Proteobacteria bacterium]|nr:fumarylacetoacetate hydrolase family protein [Pseudomonadota bacterium]